MARQDPLADLVAALQRLPGIGARSAQRLAYHLLKTPREEIDALAAAMLSVKDRVTYCSICSNITDVDPCTYCTADDRDRRLLCVVEQPENIASVEKTRGFRGRYHVLMGTIAPLQGIGPDDLKIKGLLGRIGDGGVEEVILATNPTVEGEATALYLARLIKPSARASPASPWASRSGAISITRTSSRCKGDGGTTEM
jgi:recombination protein RecR